VWIPSRAFVSLHVAAGVFYGLQCCGSLLLSRLRARVSRCRRSGGGCSALGYRGFMLDVAATSTEALVLRRSISSPLQAQCLSHALTDDEGWRVEIPSLPSDRVGRDAATADRTASHPRSARGCSRIGPGKGSFPMRYVGLCGTPRRAHRVIRRSRCRATRAPRSNLSATQYRSTTGRSLVTVGPRLPRYVMNRPRVDVWVHRARGGDLAACTASRCAVCPHSHGVMRFRPVFGRVPPSSVHAGARPHERRRYLVRLLRAGEQILRPRDRPVGLGRNRVRKTSREATTNIPNPIRHALARLGLNNVPAVAPRTRVPVRMRYDVRAESRDQSVLRSRVESESGGDRTRLGATSTAQAVDFIPSILPATPVSTVRNLWTLCVPARSATDYRSATLWGSADLCQRRGGRDGRYMLV